MSDLKALLKRVGTDDLLELQKVLYDICDAMPPQHDEDVTSVVIPRLEELLKDCGMDILKNACIHAACRVIVSMGNASRLRVIRDTYEMDVRYRRHLVTRLCGNFFVGGDSLHAEIIDLLATSNHPADWTCLSEVVHVLEQGVSQEVVKKALVTAWKKATGITRKNLAYDLRKRGYKQVGLWWF